LSERAVPMIGVAAGSAPLRKTQRQFNQLVERLTRQREELRVWQTYKQRYEQQLASDYQPLAARLREKRVAMVVVLDRAMDAAALGQRERKKVKAILDTLLAELLAEAEDPELVRIYDKYADVSFGDDKRARMELLKTMASEEYGVDIESYSGGDTVEDLTDWLRDQVREARAEPDKPPRKKAAKSAEGGAQAIRDVFRKLVSELHPDRETDPEAHARKTELMQRVNKAYKAGDLLSLLELQVGIEQIDAAALGGVAEERMRRYIQVLNEQSRRLRDELADLVAPFAGVVGEPRPRTITPAAVQRALEGDVRKLKETLRTVEMDLMLFKNTSNLKRSLEHYRVESR
jgi:hypothetical protein